MIPTLLKNSEERKRSDAGHIKAAFDDRNHINSKLDPGHRLEFKKRWEIARRKNFSSEERNKSVTGLFELVRGNGRLLEASKNKYSKYIVCKLMKFCPEYRSKILTEFKGQIKKLFLHTESGIVLLEVYELSNAMQRSSLLEEFYGPEFTLFKI
ncbi:ARM repeat-containing protein [Gigaspora margarita]|uniref:ARM repeat-containing protein n=1 Tax=Gigaspora margarita TaxID=4874 RepID=A0A8H4EN63_GIGMA|nr:ARM repeat-containing protein [Gigaspora margarita]